MNIAIDKTPIISAHKYRGIGIYNYNLIKNLERFDEKNYYYEFISGEELPKEADILHYPNLDLFRANLKIYKGVKTIVTIHDLIPLLFPKYFPIGLKGKISWLRQKKTLDKVDAVITDSLSSKEDIKKLTGFPPAKIHVVYLASSISFKKINELEIDNLKNQIRKKYGLNNDFILYVGDVNWNKNIFGIVSAFAKIHKSYPQTDLIFVGKAFLEKDLKEKRLIDDKIVELNLERNIIKTGYVPSEDLSILYKLAKVYLEPSFYEGFGLPILDAMFCGTPVVCSACGSIPEIVKDAAILVDPKSAASIKEGIEKVLKMSNQEIAKLRNREIEQAKKFTWEKTARETIRVYEKVYKSAY